MTMTSPCAALQAPRLGSANALRAIPVRGIRASRSLSTQVAAAVQFDYDTKVFKKELVKFADTEEYIYRCDRGQCSANCSVDVHYTWFQGDQDSVFCF